MKIIAVAMRIASGTAVVCIVAMVRNSGGMCGSGSGGYSLSGRCRGCSLFFRGRDVARQISLGRARLSCVTSTTGTARSRFRT